MSTSISHPPVPGRPPWMRGHDAEPHGVEFAEYVEEFSGAVTEVPSRPNWLPPRTEPAEEIEQPEFEPFEPEQPPSDQEPFDPNPAIDPAELIELPGPPERDIDEPLILTFPDEESNRSRWWIVGSLASTGVHLLVLLLLSLLLVWWQSEQEEHLSLDSGFAAAPDVSDLDEEESNATEDSIDQLVVSTDAERIAEIKTEVITPKIDATAEIGIGVNGVPLPGDNPIGAGAGNPNFFGISGRGNRFVFIVDSSSSMSSNERHELARRELLAALDRMTRKQDYLVIYFSTGADPVWGSRGEGKLVNVGHAKDTESVRATIRQRTPGGSTRPVEAFQIALATKPDTIFFLTDGAIPGYTLDTVRAENTADTVIHTICLQNEAGRKILQQLAKENRGRYRFVK